MYISSVSLWFVCIHQVEKLLSTSGGGLDALTPQPGMEPGVGTPPWLSHCVVRGQALLEAYQAGAAPLQRTFRDPSRVGTWCLECSFCPVSPAHAHAHAP